MDQLQLQRAKNVSTVPAVPYVQDMCYAPKNDSMSFAMCPQKEFSEDDFFQLPVEKNRGFACLADSIYKDGERLVIPEKCIKNILKKYADFDIDKEWKKLVAEHISRKDRQLPTPPKAFREAVEDTFRKIWFSYDSKKEAIPLVYKNKAVRDFLIQAYCASENLKYTVAGQRYFPQCDTFPEISLEKIKLLVRYHFEDRAFSWEDLDANERFDIYIQPTGIKLKDITRSFSYYGDGKDTLNEVAKKVAASKDFKCEKVINRNLAYFFWYPWPNDLSPQLLENVIEVYPQEYLNEDINAYNDEGDTPLLHLMKNRKVHFKPLLAHFEALCKGGADISLTDKDGKNAYHALIDSDINHTSFMLRAIKASPKEQVLKALMQEYPKDAWPPDWFTWSERQKSVPGSPLCFFLEGWYGADDETFVSLLKEINALGSVEFSKY